MTPLMKYLLAAIVALASSLPAAGQSFPDKPIKLIVPYNAGGPTDVVGRLVADHVSKRLKHNMVVDNRVGASGMIGSQFVAKAPPDGYSLIFAVADTHSIHPHLNDDMTYDARRDFAPVALLGHNPAAVVVNPSLQVKDVNEFIRMAKANPGKITFASWGIGSSGHIRMEMLKRFAGINIVHVPYSGAAPALTAVMGGHVDSLLVPMAAAVKNHQAGKLRIIGSSTEQRASEAPDAPTFAEQGLPIDISVWLGIMAPAKTPADVVNLLNREINAVLVDPQARSALIAAGLQIATPNTPQDFAKYIQSEYERWGTAIREAAIKLK